MNYYGFTYPKMFSFKLILWVWKKINCNRNIHLFVEVWGPEQHYLTCDACNLIVNITTISEEYTDGQLQ